MATTAQFQSIPDFYTTQKECEQSKYKKIQSNQRYPLFKQAHFTAGDIEQFEHYRDPTNGTNPNPEFLEDENIWTNENFFEPDEAVLWKKYRNLTTESVYNTFRYLFNKFKKSVFVKIKDNKLDVFLPFSKINYTNEWGSKMIQDPTKFRTLTDFLIYSNTLQGYKNSQSGNFIQNPWEWYANNCLLRYENPLSENDKGLSAIKNMLEELCQNRIIPDIEIFINKRDFPLIKKDDTEPYENIFDDPKFKLISHRYEKYCPILSMVGTDNNADIPIPTAEDWTRASNQEDGKFFSDMCKSYVYDFNIPWNDKIPTAIFRGSSTGCGTEIDTNPRLKISYLSTISPVVNNVKLLDAGITKWNLRPRKIMGNKYLQVIDPRTLPFGLVNPLDPKEQSRYKYVVNIDGHVSAFRLSLELSCGSVILLVDSKYKMWFRKYLIEYVHYVPVKEDLTDLFEKIEWCRNNDDKCEEIASNAKKFYKKYLLKKGILDYLQVLFFDIKKTTGSYFYNSIKIQDIILQQEHNILSDLQSANEIPEEILPVKKLSFPFEERNYNGMQGLQLYIRKMGGIDIPNKIVVHQSKDGIIYKGSGMFSDSNIKLIIKKSQRTDELVNEAFVGITSINDLIREIPNFRYTYCISRSPEGLRDTSILENIEGDTFKKYATECTMSSFKKSLMMILMALSVAQERVGFVHNDLYPWNIIMMKVKKQQITYQTADLIFTVSTDIVPVIIDYGRSHVIYEQNHYGTMKPFKTSMFMDCFCLIVSSIYEYSSRKKMSEEELSSLINIINFFTGADFYPRRNIQDYNGLMSFLGVHKKYNEMVFGDKCALERHNSLNMFLHLYEMGNSDFIKIVYPKKAGPPSIPGNQLFYYDIIIGKDPKDDILKYLDNIEYCVDTIHSGPTNILSYINTRNYFTMTIVDILKNFKGDKKVEMIAQRILDRVNIQYLTHWDQMSEEINTGYINPNESLIIANYTPETFSIPGKILSNVQGNVHLKNTNILTLRNMFIFNILYDVPFRIPKEKEFFENHDKILKIRPLVKLNYNANYNTLKNISKILYTHDTQELNKIPDKPTKILNIFNEILSVISK